MTDAVQCDQCRTVGRLGRRGWVRAQTYVKGFGSERKEDVDLCSRQCVFAYFAGPCSADPTADWHDYVGDDDLGEKTCARCGDVLPPLGRAVGVR